jgi:hypothetical protein
MKIKFEYVVLVIVIGLLSLYLLLHKTDKTHYRLPVLPPLAAGDISKIEIVKPDTTLVLSKVGERWRVEPQGYPVANSRIDDMLNVIKSLTLTAMVSESKNFERYDLQEAKRLHVRAWAGDVLKREFDIGKAASSFRHTFIKIAGDDRVYHARENFRTKFDQTVESLHDKQVLAFEADTIDSIRLVRGATATLITRSQVPAAVTAGDQPPTPPAEQTAEPQWQTSEGVALDTAKIKNLLNTLAHLNCDKYLYDRTKNDLKDSMYTVELKGLKEYTLTLFPATDPEAGPYPAVSSENDTPFLLPERQVKNIMVPVEDLALARKAS